MCDESSRQRTTLARGMAALAMCAAALPGLALGATRYSVDAAKSTLGFTASQTGAEFDGHFGKFTAQIVFSPDDLAGSRFDVLVDTRSVDTQDDDRDTALRGSDLFHVEKYPQAHFVSTAFARKAAGAYEAQGKLTIRDVTREIRVPFTLMNVREGGRDAAWLKGAVQLKRLDFGVGQGEWQDTTWVANEVTVKFTLHLLPASAAAGQKPAAPSQDKKPAAPSEKKPAAAPEKTASGTQPAR